MMCIVFKLSRASYYKWLRSGPRARWQENEQLLAECSDPLFHALIFKTHHVNSQIWRKKRRLMS